MVIKFRTVKRLCLAALIVTLIVPTGVLIGLAVYYRGSGYRRRIAADLSEALGVRVAVGRVERLGRRGLTLSDLSIGGTAEAPLISAKRAVLEGRDADGRDLTLEEVILTVRSRQALDDLLSLPAAVARSTGSFRVLRFSEATCDWGIGASFQADVAEGAAMRSAPGEPAEAYLTLAQGDRRVCSVRWRQSPTGLVVVEVDGVPARLVQSAGLLPDFPVGDARVSGRVEIAAGHGDRPATVDVTFAGLALGPPADRWGVLGVDARCSGSFKAETSRWGSARVLHIDVRGPDGEGASIGCSAVRRLAYVGQTELADLPETADRVRLRAFHLTATREEETLVLAGGLEPAGTVMTGELPGDTEPRALLRLGRTTFTLDELGRRLAEARRGDVDRPRPAPASRPASRAAP